jgi:hypothetical protein
MIGKSSALRALAVVGVVAGVACSDAITPTQPPDVSNAVVVEAQGLTDAVDLDAMARDIKGFGGYFLDNGVPTIYLTDAGERAAAERTLGVASSQLRVRRADFEYQALDQWFTSLSREALAVPGVAFVDLDESTNRLLIGVENNATGPAASAQFGVFAAAARLGIPSTAVAVRQVEPVKLAVTLRDRVRPVRGGFQINFPGFLCTLGFNATSGGQRSFITNSHCTSVQGGVENTPYWQPTQAANNAIGTEVADPVYVAGGACPPGRFCRRSDASRGAYNAGTTSNLGRIGRTTGPNNGSLTIGSPANFIITSESNATNFAIGLVVNKVGRTTGWTQGQVTNTCVTTNVSGSLITQLCQTFVAAGVNGGDSGSPVFRILSSNNVRLLGILWGGIGTTTFVFSPFTQIEQELGPLTTF